MIAPKHYLRTQTHLRESMLQHLWISARSAKFPHSAHVFFRWKPRHRAVVFERSEGYPCVSHPLSSRGDLLACVEDLARSPALDLDGTEREWEENGKRGRQPSDTAGWKSTVGSRKQGERRVERGKASCRAHTGACFNPTLDRSQVCFRLMSLN